MANVRNDTSAMPRDAEGASNFVELKRIDEVIKGSLPAAIRALQNASSGTVKRQLIPIYLKMDNDLSSAGEAVACRAGCSYCCYYHVAVTAAEALALAEHLRGLSTPQQEHLTRKLYETAKQVAPLSQAEYIHTNIPCAFLDNDRCSVYDARPVACRGFHSVNVDPCRAAFENPQSLEPMTFAPDRQAVNEAYKNVMLIAQHQTGCDTTMYEMHTAITEALTNGSSVKRWKKGKVAFPTVADRVSLEERMSTGG
jgi:Fe-S-cluster containining protein